MHMFPFHSLHLYALTQIIVDLLRGEDILAVDLEAEGSELADVDALAALHLLPDVCIRGIED